MAQSVLQGKTKGYANHPQLIRFKNAKNPLGAIATYLRHVAIESEKRGYQFDRSKIPNRRTLTQILVTDGQIKYEYKHLLEKLKVRDPARYQRLTGSLEIKAHPLFKEHDGNVEAWEVIQ